MSEANVVGKKGFEKFSGRRSTGEFKISVCVQALTDSARCAGAGVEFWGTEVSPG